MSDIVLMYHCVYRQTPIESGFQNESAMSYKIASKVFEEQVRILTQLSPNTVFSFDDGGISFFDVIAPILEKYGQKGLFFIATKYIGTKGFLSESQIKDLHMRGHIIASHSHSHSNLSLMAYDKVVDEWRNSLMILSRICGENISCASIPFGGYSDNVVRAAGAAGISSLYTSQPTLRLKSKYGVDLHGRYVVHSYTSLDNLKRTIDSKLYRILVLTKFNAIQMAKHMLKGFYGDLKSLVLSK